ncbi:EAL and HDOD domain-containing protein [Noviherbaspirillum galbum]|uniref:HDOD domain-containing protein n=1 Tax=Noviherbaspirillum galbum TaxID=2709383 RepID=A0A6B3SZE9_9BURK|nr:HDOD domain-containing protein [Noviherbaspirillum galbum]NEX63999.1 HDOD domain-containing protein [Noviherbaspirillum galbum]
MTRSSSPVPALIELLADKTRAPSTIRLRPEILDPAMAAEIVSSDAFSALAKRFSCLLVEPVAADAALVEELARQGCKTVPVAALHVLSKDAPAAVPATAAWLAGDWWTAPPAKPNAAQSASRTLALQLVQLVNDDADTHEIEAVLRRDPTMSYQLLRVVNSLGMGMSRQITSFSQAILIMGRAQLRRWLNLMLFSSRQGDERSAMLLARVAVRARTMELLAKASGMDKATQEAAFMAGMFSLLGVLFGMPLAEVLKPLKISDAIRQAVLEHGGDIGCLLDTATWAEQWMPGQDRLDQLHLSAHDFHGLLVESYLWMSEVIQEPNGGKHA